MSDTTEKILLQLDIDNTQLNQKLQDTLQQVQQFTNNLSGLSAALKDAFKAGNVDDIQALAKQVQDTQNAIDSLTAAAQKYQDIMGTVSKPNADATGSFGKLSDAVAAAGKTLGQPVADVTSLTTATKNISAPQSGNDPASLFAKEIKSMEDALAKIQATLDALSKNPAAGKDKAAAGDGKPSADEAQKASDDIETEANNRLARLQLSHSKQLISDKDYSEAVHAIQDKEFDDKMKLYDEDTANYIKANTDKLNAEAKYEDGITAADKKGAADRIADTETGSTNIKNEIKNQASGLDADSNAQKIKNNKGQVDDDYDDLEDKQKNNVTDAGKKFGADSDEYKAQVKEEEQIENDHRQYDLDQTTKYEKAKAAIQKKYLDEGSALISAVSDAVAAAQKDEVTAAGNNSEKIKQINKKYALINLAIKSASIITSTAEAIAANSVYGPAAPFLDAIVIATGAVQEGAAIAQYNRVSSMAKGGTVMPGKMGVIGGKPHSQGGTKFYGTDGTMFEAERGELLAVINRNSTEMLSRFSALNQMGGGVSFFGNTTTTYAADGGLIARNVSAPVEQNFAMEKFGNAVGNPLVICPRR